MQLIGLPVHLTKTPEYIRSTPPALGQHTDTILQRFCISFPSFQPGGAT
jgi:hypothetical protein